MISKFDANCCIYLFIISKRDNDNLISVYISEMRYYVDYLHFSDYCHHLCRHVYHNVPAVVRSSLFQVVGMSNLTFNPPEEGRSVQQPERCDKHGDKDDDNSKKNLNNVIILCFQSRIFYICYSFNSKKNYLFFI